jgi:predicted small metal-binding protein
MVRLGCAGLDEHCRFVAVGTTAQQVIKEMYQHFAREHEEALALLGEEQRSRFLRRMPERITENQADQRPPSSP